MSTQSADMYERSFRLRVAPSLAALIQALASVTELLGKTSMSESQYEALMRSMKEAQTEGTKVEAFSTELVREVDGECEDLVVEKSKLERARKQLEGNLEMLSGQIKSIDSSLKTNSENLSQKKSLKEKTERTLAEFTVTGWLGWIVLNMTGVTEGLKARLAACREDISKCEREQITFSMKREQKLLEMKVIKEQLMQNKVMSAGKQARLAQLAEVQETLKQCTTFLSLLEGKVSCLHCQDQCFFHVDTLVTTIRDIIHHLVEGLSNDHCKPLCTELGEVMSHELNSMKETISHISVCGAGVSEVPAHCSSAAICYFFAGI
ncbi:uncharacterized protein LOC121848513 [Callorhinchus milii]|uniref:uncharacterized protein LOC121848513 n=1 Tax=Callorhinchus milii TaxID=7868 RepID=UPI001C3FC6E6|nr:uncharacterized protein LOC121848513 [Callorhinchus milii]